MADRDTYVLSNFDCDLQMFYYNVIKKEININIMWKVHGVRRALGDIVQAYKQRPRRKSDIRFDTPYKRCAYILKHSPCFTSVVAKYFYTLTNNNAELLKDAFENGCLSLCCLGGGPATDAVAVIRIIRHLYQPYWAATQKILKITITTVDVSEEWQVTATNVLNCLENTPAIFGNGEISISFKFITADLTKRMDEDLKSAIRSADIITMIYFLSAVNGTKEKSKSPKMVENIMLTMKKKAFVFFLDSAKDQHYKILNIAAEKRKVMQEIYGPLVEEFHTISIESVQKFLDLYSKHFKRLICMTNIFFCVSAWKKPSVKNMRQQIIEKGILQKKASWKIPTEEESEDLTLQMKKYKTEVYRVLRRKTFSRLNYPMRSAGNLTNQPHYSKQYSHTVNKITDKRSNTVGNDISSISSEEIKNEATWQSTQIPENTTSDNFFDKNYNYRSNNEVENEQFNPSTKKDLQSPREKYTNEKHVDHTRKKSQYDSTVHRLIEKAYSPEKNTRDIRNSYANKKERWRSSAMFRKENSTVKPFPIQCS